MPGHRHPDPGCKFFQIFSKIIVSRWRNISLIINSMGITIIGFISSPLRICSYSSNGFVKIHNFSDPCFSAVNFLRLLCAKADNFCSYTLLALHSIFLARLCTEYSYNIHPRPCATPYQCSLCEFISNNFFTGVRSYLMHSPACIYWYEYHWHVGSTLTLRPWVTPLRKSS